jgi:hypothetical protein
VRAYWKSVRDDERAARMTEYVNSLSPGALLETFTLSDINNLSEPLSMVIDYALPKHAVRAKDLMYLRLPTLEREYPEVALETRKYPLQYMTTEERDLEIDLKIPEGFRAAWLPPPLEISNAYVEFKASYQEVGSSSAADGGVVQYRETFRRLQRIVPVQDYDVYRDALRTISAFSKNEVFLTSGSLPASRNVPATKEG